jgi:hypothetical protein
MDRIIPASAIIPAIFIMPISLSSLAFSGNPATIEKIFSSLQRSIAEL